MHLCVCAFFFDTFSLSIEGRFFLSYHSKNPEKTNFPLKFNIPRDRKSVLAIGKKLKLSNGTKKKTGAHSDTDPQLAA